MAFLFQAASLYAEQFYEKFWQRVEEPGDFPNCLQLQHAGPVEYMTVVPRLNLSPIPRVSQDDSSLGIEPLTMTPSDSDDDKENIAPNF